MSLDAKVNQAMALDGDKTPVPKPRQSVSASTEKKKRSTGRVVSFKIAQARGLTRMDEFKELDPLVIIYIEKEDVNKNDNEDASTTLVEKARTPVQRKTLSPYWNFGCQVTIADPSEYLVLSLCDWNPEVKRGHTNVGHLRLSLEELESMQGSKDDWIEIEAASNARRAEGSEPLLLQLQVIKVDNASAVVDRATSRLYGVFQQQEEKKKERQRQPPPGCTFTPKTKSSRSSNTNSTTGIERMEQLYRRAEQTKSRQEEKRIQQGKDEVKACTFKPDTSKTMRRNSRKSSSFSQLYTDAARRKEKLDEATVVKSVEGCTFQPTVNRSRKGSFSSSKSPVPRHEMLYERSRKKLDASNISVSHELEGCTFKPDTRKSKRSHSAPKQRGNRYGNGDPQQPLHERLYQEAGVQRQKLEASQEAAKMAELNDMGTFSPKILKESERLLSQRKNNNLSTHERLYKEEKEQRKRRDSLLQEHNKENTFKPKISRRSMSVGRRRPSTNGESIFERLNKEAEEIIARRKKMEKTKSEAELNDCTFKPELSDDTRRVAANASVSDDRGSVWDRLNVDKSGTLQLREQIKQQKELEDCTFSPSLPPNKPLDETDSQFDEAEVKKSSEPVHVRLHRESASRKSVKEFHRKQQMEVEVQDCTFRPKISKRAPSPIRGRKGSNADGPIWDRLANEVNWKEREELLQRKKAEQEIANCSFHPEINRGPRASSLKPRSEQPLSVKSDENKGAVSDTASKVTQKSVGVPNGQDFDSFCEEMSSKLGEL